MKKLLTLGMLILLCPILLQAQGKRINVNNIRVEYLTVLLDSAETDKVYYLFPPTGGITSTDRHAPSETAPTSASRQAQNLSFGSSGHLYISMAIDTTTRQESDSLSCYITPYFYDNSKAAYYEVPDTTFLVFDTNQTYTSSSADWLDWTHGTGYGVTLSNELWPCAGFVLHLHQKASDTATSASTLYLGFWHIQ